MFLKRSVRPRVRGRLVFSENLEKRYRVISSKTVDLDFGASDAECRVDITVYYVRLWIDLYWAPVEQQQQQHFETRLPLCVHVEHRKSSSQFLLPQGTILRITKTN